MDKKILILEYNNRKAYECFNNTITDEFGIPDLYSTLITIEYRPQPNKRSQYIPDILPAAISVASGKYISTLTTPSDSLDLIPSCGPSTIHVMKKDFPFQGRAQGGYCFRKHGKTICNKNTRFYCYTCSDKNKKFYYYHGFSRISS